MTKRKFTLKSKSDHILYFIEYSVHNCIAYPFVLQFYLNTSLMNEVGKCYLPSKVCTQYFSIIFNEKKCALYSIKYGTYYLNKLPFKVTLLIVLEKMMPLFCHSDLVIYFSISSKGRYTQSILRSFLW